MGNSAWRRRIERSEIAVAWSAYRVYAMRAIECGVLSQTIAAQSVVLPQRGDRRADVGKTSVAYGLWWIVGGGAQTNARLCESISKKVNNRDIFFVFLLKCSAFFSLLTLTKGDGYEEGMITFSERFFSGVCIGCRA